ncbi:hypothetical protein J2809_002880 [Arthrobacter pascens]|nr:hypothetical protein [Arthrobacter pascens]
MHCLYEDDVVEAVRLNAEAGGSHLKLRVW